MTRVHFSVITSVWLCRETTINYTITLCSTLFFKRNAAWKVAFLFGKSVERWTWPFSKYLFFFFLIFIFFFVLCIARDPWGISQGFFFLKVILRTIWQNVHDPVSGSVTQGHREKWVQKFLSKKSVDFIIPVMLHLLCQNHYFCSVSCHTSFMLLL